MARSRASSTALVCLGRQSHSVTLISHMVFVLESEQSIVCSTPLRTTVHLVRVSWYVVSEWASLPTVT